MLEEQATFDFFPPLSEKTVRKKKPKGDSPEQQRRLICRSVMGWLLERQPAGMAAGVPTRFARYQADLAAFWSGPRKKFLTPESTLIVEIRHDRDACWPDCANRDELLRQLREARLEQEALEKEVRASEPHLQDTDMLFEEIQCWNYEQSSNPQYQRCRKKVEKLEHSLYRGSRFEQLRRAHVADYHYLAVPDGTVTPHELAYGWGMLYVTGDGKVKVLREALRRECSPGGRYHLIQNIAAAATRNVLFAHGVRTLKDGRIVFSPPPRRRTRIESEYCRDE